MTPKERRQRAQILEDSCQKAQDEIRANPSYAEVEVKPAPDGDLVITGCPDARCDDHVRRLVAAIESAKLAEAGIQR